MNHTRKSFIATALGAIGIFFLPKKKPAEMPAECFPKGLWPDLTAQKAAFFTPAKEVYPWTATQMDGIQKVLENIAHGGNINAKARVVFHKVPQRSWVDLKHPGDRDGGWSMDRRYLSFKDGACQVTEIWVSV